LSTTPDGVPAVTGLRGRGALLSLLLGLGVSLALLWWAVRGLRPEDVIQHVRNARPLPLALSVFFATAVFPIRALRWRLLLREADDAPLRLPAAWHGVAIGFMANNLLPFRAGEVLRAYAASRLAPVRMSSAFASVAVERVFDGLTVVATLGIALLAAGLPGGVRVAGLPVPELAQRVGLIAGATFLVAAILIARPLATARLIERLVPFRGLSRRLVGLFEGVRLGLVALRSPRRLLAVIVWSLVLWGVNALSFAALFPAFDLKVDFAGALLVQSAIVFGVAVPSSPGYVGVLEAAAIVALALYGIPHDRAFAYAITYHAATFLPITLLGLYSLVRMPAGWRTLGNTQA